MLATLANGAASPSLTLWLYFIQRTWGELREAVRCTCPLGSYGNPQILLQALALGEALPAPRIRGAPRPAAPARGGCSRVLCTRCTRRDPRCDRRTRAASRGASSERCGLWRRLGAGWWRRAASAERAAPSARCSASRCGTAWCPRGKAGDIRGTSFHSSATNPGCSSRRSCARRAASLGPGSDLSRWSKSPGPPLETEQPWRKRGSVRRPLKGAEATSATATLGEDSPGSPSSAQSGALEHSLAGIQVTLACPPSDALGAGAGLPPVHPVCVPSLASYLRSF